jgi:serine O-acetyltransferase
VIITRKDLRAYLTADLEAHGLQRWRLHYRITQRPAHFQRLLRRSEYWTNSAKTPIGRAIAAYFRLRTKILGERLGYEIPRNVFGPGLSIAHTGLIIVHVEARVGANCRIHHGVTIGEGKPGHYPIIGNDVFISPMAMVLGADVGNRVMIRPFTAVTTAVPDDVDVAGYPARIIHDRRPADPTPESVPT